jgi:hypothetical protein
MYAQPQFVALGVLCCALCCALCRAQTLLISPFTRRYFRKHPGGSGVPEIGTEAGTIDVSRCTAVIKVTSLFLSLPHIPSRLIFSSHLFPLFSSQLPCTASEHRNAHATTVPDELLLLIVIDSRCDVTLALVACVRSVLLQQHHMHDRF